MANYSFKNPPDVPDGTTIAGFNLTQAVPHTKIYKSKIGLIFRNCNLINCDIPSGSVIEHCIQLQISFCSWVHPGWYEMGYISLCPVDCSHRTTVDIITIDGLVVTNNNIYEDKGVD